MTGWTCKLSLDSERAVIDGSSEALVAAIGNGADLRIYTEFLHNEHIDTASASDELVREVAQFAVTYLVDDSWAAGIMSQRQPVELPTGFGPRPSMSFFLYNQDGTQAIARPYLDGTPTSVQPGPAASERSDMAKYHWLGGWDAGTNAPSHNFVYDFEVFRFFVRDRWEELLAADDRGTVTRGSVAALAEAFSAGRAIKVGVRPYVLTGYRGPPPISMFAD